MEAVDAGGSAARRAGGGGLAAGYRVARLAHPRSRPHPRSRGLRVSTAPARNSPMSEHDLVIKTVVLGDCGSGKTSLIRRFACKEFNANPQPFDNGYKITTLRVDPPAVDDAVGGASGGVAAVQGGPNPLAPKIAKFTVWDSDGTLISLPVLKLYLYGVRAVAIAVDLTSSASLAGVDQWVTRLARARAPQSARRRNTRAEPPASLAVLLIGTKADMARRRQVSASEVLEVARRIGACYVETSSKLGTGVHEAFALLARLAMGYASAGISEKDSSADDNPAPDADA